MESFFPEILITYLLHFRQGFYSTGYGYFQLMSIFIKG
jgi:hypothetical protein